MNRRTETTTQSQLQITYETFQAINGRQVIGGLGMQPDRLAERRGLNCVTERAICMVKIIWALNKGYSSQKFLNTEWIRVVAGYTISRAQNLTHFDGSVVRVLRRSAT